MKIGIIVHSQTGNTLSVAARLQERLMAAGHTVSIEKLVPDDENQTDAGRIRLQAIPDAGAYDSLIFGAPVRGAAVSATFKSYVAQITSLRGQKACCYVTEFFPFAWMGGNRAISQMKDLCDKKGAVTMETGVVNWKSVNREKMIAEVVERFCKVF